MPISFLGTAHWLSQESCLSWEAFYNFPDDWRDSSSVFCERRQKSYAVTKPVSYAFYLHNHHLWSLHRRFSAHVLKRSKNLNSLEKSVALWGALHLHLQIPMAEAVPSMSFFSWLPISGWLGVGALVGLKAKLSQFLLESWLRRLLLSLHEICLVSLKAMLWWQSEAAGTYPSCLCCFSQFSIKWQ